MGFLEAAGWLLVVFYLGAVAASGRCWIGIIRGRLRYAQLRDVTGIGDVTMLRRHFGLTSGNGFYRVSLGEVLRLRRPSGLVLTDMPVHTMFAIAFVLTLGSPASPAFIAVLVAASAHALVLAVAVGAILTGGRRRPLAE